MACIVVAGERRPRGKDLYEPILSELRGGC